MSIVFSLILLGAGCFGIGGGTTTSGSDGGVFKTADSGDTWAQVSAVPSSKGVGSIASANVLSLEMDPQDHTVLYAGTRANGLLYSLNAAASWQQPRTDALKEGSIGAIEVAPDDVCTVYVAKGQRLYKTVNCARSFDAESYVETRTGVSILNVAVDWFNTQVVYIGLSNGDVLKSEDAGENWRNVLTAKTGITAFIVNNTDSRMLLAGTDKDGMYRSTDAGATWTQVEKELKDFKGADKVTAFTQDKTSATVIAATGYGLIRSKDFGSTWEAIALVTSAGQVLIKSVAMDPGNANLIYYAASSTFYRSMDGGANWDPNKLATTRIPEAILVDPTDPKVVYVGVAETVKK